MSGRSSISERGSLGYKAPPEEIFMPRSKSKQKRVRHKRQLKRRRRVERKKAARTASR